MEKKNVCNRWAKDRVEISKTASARKRYLIVIPVGEGFIAVFVHPNKTYGEFTGKQLIAEYLSRFWKKGTLADTGAKRQSKYLHKRRYGNNRTRADLERVTRLGNPRNDLEFQKHQKKLKELEGNIKGKRDYLRNLERMKKKLKYEIDNQADCISEWTEEEKRLMLLQQNEEDKHAPYTKAEIIDDEEEE